MRRDSLNRSPVGVVGNRVAHAHPCAGAALSRSSSSKVGVFMRRIIRRTSLAVALLVSLATLVTLVASPSWANSRHHHHGDDHVVNIPETDKFVPFHLTITEGDTVTWVNSDTDDHTVVSDDAFNDAGHNGLNQLIPGTDTNNGQAGTFTLEFDHTGTFVYYCRFHSKLDADNQ